MQMKRRYQSELNLLPRNFGGWLHIKRSERKPSPEAVVTMAIPPQSNTLHPDSLSGELQVGRWEGCIVLHASKRWCGNSFSKFGPPDSLRCGGGGGGGGGGEA